MYPGEQLNLLGAGSNIDAVVDDQHLLTLFACQYVHEPNSHRHRAQQKRPPVIPGIIRKLVGGVSFRKANFGSLAMPTPKLEYDL